MPKAEACLETESAPCLTSWLKPRAVRDGKGEIRTQLGNAKKLDAGVAHDVLNQHMLRRNELGLVFIGYELSLLSCKRGRENDNAICYCKMCVKCDCWSLPASRAIFEGGNTHAVCHLRETTPASPSGSGE